ncbi:MAG: phosphate ABC transporter substrate-binding protein [Pseudanabaenaceae cyanobacterium SKYGB_i_bin29]|nr:phosphate ABC transporter substrate-binding protein [Pseudanabaenaceae cyanobacterium SKYG29]MDW8421695.1 phosphate ABC transporter substrate-binding protein [Pseudanabaenaceae cyanobacterium SKYGB_i_bin29]
MAKETSTNETIVLALSFLITAGLAGGLWWLLRDRTGPSQQTPPIVNTGSNSSVPTGTFNYGGSTTWAPIRAIVDPEITKDYPQFRLRYVDPIGRTPGSGTGIQMLIDRQLSFSQSSRSINDKEQARAQLRGFRLRQLDVAIDGLVVAVNHSLPVQGITVAELRDIYTGKIRNWREVGGPDLPITPYSRRLSDGGTVEFFWEYVMDKQDFGSNVQFVYSTTPGLREVSKNVGGIYYATAPEVVPQCTVKTLPLGRTRGNYVKPYTEPFIPPTRCPGERNSINITAFQSGEYPITRKLFVITRDEDNLDRQAGDFYANWLLTPKGQELIAKAGFVPLR